MLSVAGRRCPRHLLPGAGIQGRSREFGKSVRLPHMIGMSVGDKNVPDSHLSFSRRFDNPVRPVSGINHSRLSASAVAQQIAEISIPSEMKLKEIDVVVAKLIDDRLRWREAAFHPKNPGRELLERKSSAMQKGIGGPIQLNWSVGMGAEISGVAHPGTEWVWR